MERNLSRQMSINRHFLFGSRANPGLMLGGADRRWCRGKKSCILQREERECEVVGIYKENMVHNECDRLVDNIVYSKTFQIYSDCMCFRFVCF